MKQRSSSLGEPPTNSAESGATPVVHPQHFLTAVRDAGYRSLDSAVSELIDNSLEAHAQQIHVEITVGDRSSQESQVAVLDDGCGMTPKALQEALRFGGSSRFGLRQGLGRFGMGLPSASLSQARRVDVYSWLRPDSVIHSRLDLDDLMASAVPTLPKPGRAALPHSFRALASASGTLVLWSRLDKADLTDLRDVTRRLCGRLGRMFRNFLWTGQQIYVNGEPVQPIDPTFLHPSARRPLAEQHGEPLVYVADGSQGISGRIVVRFAELPVSKYSHWSNDQKREHGISNGAGVSIVRGGREIDYGWFFMRKRRENYDDWWRAEVAFEPALDELFGVTPVKQGIRPSQALHALFGDDLRDVARSLNRRARQAHNQGAGQKSRLAVQQHLADRDNLLRPISGEAAPNQRAGGKEGLSRPRFEIVHEELDTGHFFQSVLLDGTVVLKLNTLHEFYRRLYFPFEDCQDQATRRCRERLDILLLALARAALPKQAGCEQQMMTEFITAWSRAIAVFCGDD